MVCRLTLIEGLGGTGKTHYIKEVCTAHSLKTDPVIYLTYNRKVAKSVEKEVQLEGVQISTIHALIYRELSLINLIPDEFADESSLGPEAFQALEGIFLKHFNEKEALFRSIPPQVVLIIDEFQNTDIRLLEVLKLICHKETTMLYLVGDRYQSIYSYRSENPADNFEQAEIIFQHPIDERIVLNKNHRSEAPILTTICSFLKKQLSVDPQYLYANEERDHGEYPILSFYESKRQEFEEVRMQCLEIHAKSGCKVAVLSRWKRNFKYFIDWKESEALPWLEVSTIHGYIGNEAEAVFIVGLELPESYLEAQVLYTGLLRAQRYLSLSTSFPSFDPAELFDGEVVQVLNSQKARSKPFKALKVVRANKNLTRRKFDKCMIDSLSLIIRDQDTPFIPFLERQPGIERNAHQKSYITQADIPIKVTYHKGRRSFIFTMNNVNRLRASDYTDSQVIKYLANFILEYFNYQIPLEAISLYDIDLCRIIEEGSPLLLKLLSGEFRCRSVLNQNADQLPGLRMADIQRGTVYLNCSSASTRSYTLVVYRPINKDNEYRYVDPRAIKVELRLRSKSILASYAFGTVPSVSGLIASIKDNPHYLHQIYDKAIQHRMKKSPGVFKVDDEGYLDDLDAVDSVSPP